MAGQHQRARWLGVDAHVAVVWAMFGLTALAIVTTYARLPAAETYNVSQDGLRGGLSRALIFLNFPTSLAALALIGISVDRLLRSGRFADGGSRAGLVAVAIVAAVLCLVTALPGVVDQNDLDARPINLLPATGTLLALGLSVAAARSGVALRVTARSTSDRLGALLVVVLLLLSLPWVLAELGVYIDDVPVLGRVFVASMVPPGETLAAVHLGHHHGLDGFLFVTTALVLGRVVRGASPGNLAKAVRVYLSLMFAYGLFNLVQDAWLEQLVKPDRVDQRIPDVLRPAISGAWGLLILGAVAAWYLLFRPREGGGVEPSVVPG